MTPEQALQVLDKAVAAIDTNRETHQIFANAINTLSRALQKPPEQEEKKPSK